MFLEEDLGSEWEMSYRPLPGGLTVSLVTERAEVAVNPVFMVGLGCLSFFTCMSCINGPSWKLVFTFFPAQTGFTSEELPPVLREGNSYL